MLDLINTRDLTKYESMMDIGGYGLNCLLGVTLTLFIRFHIRLICTNSTTIENMDKNP